MDKLDNFLLKVLLFGTSTVCRAVLIGTHLEHNMVRHRRVIFFFEVPLY